MLLRSVILCFTRLSDIVDRNVLAKSQVGGQSQRAAISDARPLGTFRFTYNGARVQVTETPAEVS